MLLVTGGAGFVGARFIQDWFDQSHEPLVNVDSLTYAANPAALAALAREPGYAFSHTDINDRVALDRLFQAHRPRAVVHFAAESHVDRSIHDPARFVQTNIVGTLTLLEAARAFWDGLDARARAAFRFVHVSTDEVYGSLPDGAPAFAETTAYAPNSPYSASKAGADHLVRAYHHTYGLPTLTTHCSNNYGPCQFPEKLIPLVIANALAGRILPIYGDGGQVRDWLFVGDHCAAIRAVLDRGRPGETYNVGGAEERTNLDVVQTLCDLLDALKPKPGGSYRDQIAFVADRPGHDRRYAIDSRKIAGELGWRPSRTFAAGIEQTLRWYLDHPA